MGRRCKYDPPSVIQTILSNPLLYKVAEIIFSSNRPLHSTEVGKILGISQGYAYSLLQRLERWGVVEPLRDPKNGKTMFKPSERKVARLLAEEIRKRKVQDLVVFLDARGKRGDQEKGGRGG